VIITVNNIYHYWRSSQEKNLRPLIRKKRANEWGTLRIPLRPELLPRPMSGPPARHGESLVFPLIRKQRANEWASPHPQGLLRPGRVGHPPLRGAPSRSSLIRPHCSPNEWATRP